MVVLSHSAFITRHWFEVDQDDACMQHGARMQMPGRYGHGTGRLVGRPRRWACSSSAWQTAGLPAVPSSRPDALRWPMRH